jgi:hypothetical protein
MNIIKAKLKVQKTRYNQGACAALGINENEFYTERVHLDEAANARVIEIVKGALAKAIDVIVSNSGAENPDKLKAGILQNVENFELCNGSGFTQVHEKELRTKYAGEKYASLWPVAGEKEVSTANATAVKF